MALSKYMQDDLDRLKNITEGCRPDMHEPDEQELSAAVSGQHLDNAMGDRIQPWLLERRRGVRGIAAAFASRKKGIMQENFNLATLIALARRA